MNMNQTKIAEIAKKKKEVTAGKKERKTPDSNTFMQKRIEMHPLRADTKLNVHCALRVEYDAMRCDDHSPLIHMIVDSG